MVAQSSLSEWKAWALAAGALGAGIYIGTQLKEQAKKPKKCDSNGYANGHSNGNPNDANGYQNQYKAKCVDESGKCTLVNQIVTSEHLLMEDLAMGHRLVVAFGMDELQANHFSARLPGWTPDDFWCTPGDRIWSQIFPEHLVKKSANITTNVLHSAVYKACPDALAVCHVHSPAIEAVSCLKGGLKIFAQGGTPFHDRVAYYDWQGISDDAIDECEDIAKAFKTSPKPARALMMRNHGAITVGKSVAEAFVAMYYLNRTCATQLAVLSSGAEINYPPKEVIEHAAEQFYTVPGSQFGCEWIALKNWVQSTERGEVPPILRCNLS